MRPYWFLLFVMFTPLLAGAAEDRKNNLNEIRALDWHVGPGTETIASKAILKTDDTLVFLDDVNGAKFLKLTGNIPDPGNFILLSGKDNWWAAFSFNPIGYVKDDEKIDPDLLLKKLKEGDGPSNEERKKLGIPLIHTEGWYVPPHYDQESRRLEWGLKLRMEGQTVLNYTIRILGRSGVMQATLVSSPKSLDSDVKSFKSALKGFEFNKSERYSEFKQGDHVAAYGLAALIAGGAAAVATKKGFWAVIAGFLAAMWKIIAVVFIGVFAWIASLFKKKS